MAFVDVIDDYTLGQTGTLTDDDGKSVNYRISSGADNRDDQYHGDNSAYVYADGESVLTVDFDEPTIGITVVFYGGDCDEFYSVIVDGVEVDLNSMIASGDAIFTNTGTTDNYQINADNTISGDYYTDGSIGQITFTVPVSSIGVTGAGTPNSSGSDGVEIGIDNVIFDVVCFTRGTSIMTQDGAHAIEDLRVGDLLQTLDKGAKPILWIGKRQFNSHVLNQHENLRPVRIRAGALGQGLPHHDLWTSRQHRLLISSKIAQDMFGVADVLIPAIKLVGLPGIDVDETLSSVEYIHVLLGDHEVIFAEGAPAESLFTGPEGLKSMTPHARAEILTIFPECDHAQDEGSLAHARLVPHGKMQKQLLKRHAQNKCPLLELHPI